ISGFFHLLAAVSLLALPQTTTLVGSYTTWTVWGIAVLLVVEHLLVSSRDLSRVNQAFFTVNAVIGLVLLAGISADLWLP
ncbi:MAG: 4-hydroxybenzoate octaprenyltransferase, partial [Pirellulales bacterium]